MDRGEHRVLQCSERAAKEETSPPSVLRFRPRRWSDGAESEAPVVGSALQVCEGEHEPLFLACVDDERKREARDQQSTKVLGRRGHRARAGHGVLGVPVECLLEEVKYPLHEEAAFLS